ncbi:MAG: ATP-binding protein [Janthinobacterium lividum]
MRITNTPYSDPPTLPVNRSGNPMAARPKGTSSGALQTGAQLRASRRCILPKYHAANAALSLTASRRQFIVRLERNRRAMNVSKSTRQEPILRNTNFHLVNKELKIVKINFQLLNKRLKDTNRELRLRNIKLQAVSEEANRARDFSQAIVGTMSESLIVLDADLRVTLANRAFYKTFQTSPNQTIGTKLYSLGDEQWNIAALRKLLEEILPLQRTVRDFEITHEFPGIGLRTMLLSAVQIAWSGAPLILLTIADVTKQHDHAFGLLLSANRQKDEFLAMLAHELRNPLASIRNGLQIWERGDADQDMQRRARIAAQRQLDIEIRLVEDLLDVSRITRGVITLKIAPIDFVETVRDAVETMRGDWQAMHHDVSITFPANGARIAADATRIEQIVTNLLGNAIKYTPAGGAIKIDIARETTMVRLTVSDNGIGMTADLLTTAFDIFVQAERSLDRKAAGLGLGLAIVQHLATLHHGTVQAFSNGVATGSTFVIRLPLLPCPAGLPELPMRRLDDIPRQTRLRVFIVDDNIDGLESSAALLRLDGHEVATAADGPEALRRIPGFLPDVILLDIGLPGMDGYEVARCLRTIPSQMHTLLIAHSGYGEAEHIRLASQAGFDHHLVKPADLSQLSAMRIAHCLKPGFQAAITSA